MIELIKENEAANAESINLRLRVIDKDKADVTNVYSKSETDNKFTEKLTQDVTLYVSPAGNDNTGDGSELKPYKTIDYALSKIPRNLNGFDAKVQIADGTYIYGSLDIYGYYGGNLTVSGTTQNGTILKTSLIRIDNITNITVKNLTINSDNFQGMLIGYTKGALQNITINGVNPANSSGILLKSDSIFEMYYNTISNVKTAITTRYASMAYIYGTQGDNNTIGLCAHGGIILDNGNSGLQAQTPTSKISGGQIFIAV